MFSRDVTDYQHLTNLTNEQVVIQVRLNMDNTLKRAVDSNFQNWNQLTVAQAIHGIETIVKKSSNPVVFQKEFHNTKQYEHEGIREYITRLKVLAVDCDFICPHEPTHDLTEYHLIQQLRYGISDAKLQQELLQQHSTVNSLDAITKY